MHVVIFYLIGYLFVVLRMSSNILKERERERGQIENIKIIIKILGNIAKKL